MLRSNNKYFANIKCPTEKELKPCCLINCLFQHADDFPADTNFPNCKRRASSDASSNQKKARKPNLGVSPRPLVNSPAHHKQRVQYLQAVASALCDYGIENAEAKAVELEASTAESSSVSTYPMNIRILIQKIKKGEFDIEVVREDEKKKKIKILGLLRQELKKLICDRSKLESRYIMDPPEMPAEEKPIYEETKRICDRCGSDFMVHAEPSNPCRFHLLRRQYDLEKRKLSTTFPCCGQGLGESQGCQFRKVHVYKRTDPTDLSRAIPFARTPNSNTGVFAAAVDCEMAYTTLGMELVRITVVDWDTSKTIMDRAVYPQGDILDLNTRFSGMAKIEDGTIVNGQKYAPLKFAEAMQELFKHVNDRTILVGHGLENDLIACRLCHPVVVDTALLYPENRIRTFSLKQLAWDYLSRTIQTGEHDSSEDAIAAMDIVKADISRKNGLSLSEVLAITRDLK